MVGSNAERMNKSQQPSVTWVHRKPRRLGNFSMEATFQRLHTAWKEEPPIEHTVSEFSKGIVPRWRIWREVKRLETDILHITGDINFACIAQRRRGRKVVLTIHDVGMLDEGSWVMRALKTWFLLLWPSKSCDAIIVVSDTTKQDILSRCSYPEQQIHVIPSLISSHFRERESQPSGGSHRILHIGTAANKNLGGHIAALDGTGLHLTIIGEPSEENRRQLESANLSFEIRTGLSEEEMQATYAESTALLFCSQLEGFGMPIVEAQTIGVPVITSQHDPMRHVAGDGALFCDPGDPVSIREQVLKLIQDESLRNTLIEKGKTNARRFNPQQAVAAHQAVYATI